MSASSVITFRLRGQGEGAAQRIEVEDSPHAISADAHPAFGGHDSAPSPVAYALSALTSCTQVTAQVVARDLGVRLGRFDVRLEADLDTKVMARGAEGNGNFSRVHVEASVESDATPEQFARLKAETERRCPVTQLYARSGLDFTASWTRRALAGVEA